AAGVVVSRMADDQAVGQRMMGEWFSNSYVMFITGGILTLMGLIPNMPHVAFLMLAALIAGGGWLVLQRQRQELLASAADPVQEQAAAVAAAAEASLDDVAPLDPLGLEVGYRLISLVHH